MASHKQPCTLHSSTDTPVASGMHCPPKHRYFGSGAGATTHAGANAVAEAVLRCLPAGHLEQVPAAPIWRTESESYGKPNVKPAGDPKTPTQPRLPCPPTLPNWAVLSDRGSIFRTVPAEKGTAYMYPFGARLPPTHLYRSVGRFPNVVMESSLGSTLRTATALSNHYAVCHR